MIDPLGQSSDTYIPDNKILSNYAKVLVNFALNSGKGIKKGEVVNCIIPDVAKPLARELQTAILKSGGHPIIRLTPTTFDKDFYTHASQEQLTFFPTKYLRAKADLIDHTIGIIADVDPYELKNIPPSKVMAARNAKKPFRDWLIEKENKNQYTWTLALWGVPAKAAIVGLTIEEYWQEIIAACMLDAEEPIAEWRKLKQMKSKIKKTLNELRIAELQIQGHDADLTVQLGADRVWEVGSGRNIPSFEVFSSPNWRGTEGWIRFNQPVYRYGQVIEQAELYFEKGLVTKATAKKGKELLLEMLKTENADKLGEVSLTDSRMSRISHVMAETLYDENIGGPQGNTHVAIGMAYKDCYRGDPSTVSKKQWEKMGFNDSAEHTDFVSTTRRRVTARLTDGSSLVIYDDGKFTI